MLPRLVVSGILALLLFHPRSMLAQLDLSRISVRDVEAAVRIGRMVLDNRSTISTSSSSRTARRAVETGDDYLGVPYLWGGSTPRGFDCSGFVQYVYRENGVRLPRTSRQMAHAGRSVPARIRCDQPRRALCREQSDPAFVVQRQRCQVRRSFNEARALLRQSFQQGAARNREWPLARSITCRASEGISVRSL